VAAVRVRVSPTATPTGRRAPKHAALNAAPAAALAALAESLPPSPLQDAVASLARKGPR
jgi:hypothetical protein